MPAHPIGTPIAIGAHHIRTSKAEPYHKDHPATMRFVEALVTNSVRPQDTIIVIQTALEPHIGLTRTVSRAYRS